MNSKRNPFSGSGNQFRRTRRGKSRPQQKKLKDALMQMKKMEETVNLLDAERTKLITEKKEKEAAEAAAVARIEQDRRMEAAITAALAAHMRQIEEEASTKAEAEVKALAEAEAKALAEAEAAKNGKWYSRLWTWLRE